MANYRSSKQFRLEITWSSIFKVLIGVLLAFAAVKLRFVFEMIIVAILLSVVLYRIITWTCERGWPRWLGVLLATLALLLAIGGLFGLIIPMATRESSKLVSELPKLKE